MSFKSRSIKRKQELHARKQAKKSLKKHEQLLASMPNACLKCGFEFDKNEKSNLDSWMISVQYEHNKIELMCPTCSEIN